MLPWIEFFEVIVDSREGYLPLALIEVTGTINLSLPFFFPMSF